MKYEDNHTYQWIIDNDEDKNIYDSYFINEMNSKIVLLPKTLILKTHLLRNI
jgi:hypothetical protein